MDICLIGVDPGPVAGAVRLLLHRRVDGLGRYLHQADALQVTPGAIEEVLNGLVQDYSYREDWRVVVAVEQFVVGPRAARSAHSNDGDVTRRVLSNVRSWAIDRDWSAHVRTASEVKPWATDVRLAKAGLHAPTEGMRHARDAARHALFTAVRTCSLPDPLSCGKYAAVTSRGEAIDFRGRGA
jgi:hypothetical protein